MPFFASPTSSWVLVMLIICILLLSCVSVLVQQKAGQGTVLDTVGQKHISNLSTDSLKLNVDSVGHLLKTKALTIIPNTYGNVKKTKKNLKDSLSDLRKQISKSIINATRQIKPDSVKSLLYSSIRAGVNGQKQKFAGSWKSTKTSLLGLFKKNSPNHKESIYQPLTQ